MLADSRESSSQSSHDTITQWPGLTKMDEMRKRHISAMLCELIECYISVKPEHFQGKHACGYISVRVLFSNHAQFVTLASLIQQIYHHPILFCGTDKSRMSKSFSFIVVVLLNNCLHSDPL